MQQGAEEPKKKKKAADNATNPRAQGSKKDFVKNPNLALRPPASAHSLSQQVLEILKKGTSQEDGLDPRVSNQAFRLSNQITRNVKWLTEILTPEDIDPLEIKALQESSSKAATSSAGRDAATPEVRLPGERSERELNRRDDGLYTDTPRGVLNSLLASLDEHGRELGAATWEEAETSEFKGSSVHEPHVLRILQKIEALDKQMADSSDKMVEGAREAQKRRRVHKADGWGEPGSWRRVEDPSLLASIAKDLEDEISNPRKAVLTLKPPEKQIPLMQTYAAMGYGYPAGMTAAAPASAMPFGVFPGLQATQQQAAAPQRAGSGVTSKKTTAKKTPKPDEGTPKKRGRPPGPSKKQGLAAGTPNSGSNPGTPGNPGTPANPGTPGNSGDFPAAGGGSGVLGTF